jgi:hypothetical protein
MQDAFRFPLCSKMPTQIYPDPDRPSIARPGFKFMISDGEHGALLMADRNSLDLLATAQGGKRVKKAFTNMPGIPWMISLMKSFKNWSGSF